MFFVHSSIQFEPIQRWASRTALSQPRCSNVLRTKAICFFSVALKCSSKSRSSRSLRDDFVVVGAPFDDAPFVTFVSCTPPHLSQIGQLSKPHGESGRFSLDSRDLADPSPASRPAGA